MTALELLAQLEGKGIRVRADGGLIRMGPRAAVTSEDREAVAALKPELLEILSGQPAVDLTGETPTSAGGPRRAAPPRHAAAAAQFLPMPLDLFKASGARLEVSVPWLNMTLWFVPTENDANILVKRGVSRGRIWTAGELIDLMSVDSLTKSAARTIALAKLEFDGDVIGVWPRDAGHHEGPSS
jgi:hypothetical protein